ncbi:DUF1501 domain-containing protein [Paenibacillus radicis (ex Xue et al. 2023)]|uniref:DUF1501 domain-containing protein n=1 Tax=Paenibacillus radicis (ex Xue et al. 2023) TaxID=2972489 RepID=A0ABT1YJM3_9BACL|nr:DUF1501 domain-containing protein [Paenibacillus radicis (ex Xue et al. 2023)]MCR8633381.1 DUF1501 domain-containing protein [Paenibacillus radicis (ex Xue et al. 2023)]
MKLTRRDFLIKGTALLATLGFGGPMIFAEGEQPISNTAEIDPGVESPVLVVIQMSGGNDGINTLIPYGMGGYFDSRPTLNITQSEVLAINNEVGLHPSLMRLNELYKGGKLAIIQGVGYPKPDHSHFRSMEIWQTAMPDKYIRSGWLGRYIESSLSKDRNYLRALQVGNNANKAFNSDRINVPVIQSIESYNLFDPKTPKADQNRLAKAFLDMYDPERQGTQVKVTCQRGTDAYQSVEAIHSLTNGYQNKVEYPKTNIAKDLQLVSKLLAGNSGTRVFYVELGGFDDHIQEKEQHAKLLKQLDEAIGSFYADLETQGLHERVVTMAFSEFGRRVKENGNGGTDHGTAAPVLIFGGKVKGGLYGVMPSLTNLDNGDLKYEVDFRSVYYTLVDSWLKGDANTVMNGAYEKLGFI